MGLSYIVIDCEIQELFHLRADYKFIHISYTAHLFIE